MAKPFTNWTVLPHGSIERPDSKLLTVSGRLSMPPMGELERRMTSVRLRDGRLVIYSAIALSEPHMSVLQAFGTPAYLVVPSALHRMDTRIWKDRYPAMRVIAPAGARARVQEIVPVDATDVDFGDPAVRFVPLRGTDAREAALVVEGEIGTTLILNDLIFNLPNRPGLLGWIFKMVGMTGDEPRIAPVIRKRLVVDPGELSTQLAQWSRLPNLRRILVAHGTMITREPARVLKRISEELATRARPRASAARRPRPVAR